MGDKKGVNIFKGTFFDFSIILAFYCQFCDFESVSKAFFDDDDDDDDEFFFKVLKKSINQDGGSCYT